MVRNVVESVLFLLQFPHVMVADYDDGAYQQDLYKRPVEVNSVIIIICYT